MSGTTHAPLERVAGLVRAHDQKVALARPRVIDERVLAARAAR